MFGTQTQQSVKTYLRPQQSKPMPQGTEIKNGYTGNNEDLPPGRGVDNIHRFQGRLLPHTDTAHSWKSYQFKALPVHSFVGYQFDPKEGTVRPTVEC